MKKHIDALTQYLLTLTFFIFIVSTTLLGFRIVDIVDADRLEQDTREEALIKEYSYEIKLQGDQDGY